jgi:hypothetical protein
MMNEDDFWADLKSRIREWRTEGTRDCGKDKVPTTNESEFLIPEAYIMYCPRCGNKWATRKEKGQKCGECDRYGSVSLELYPGHLTVPKTELQLREVED